MEKKELYKMAYESMVKVGEYKEALESYLDEAKQVDRDVTKEDTEHIEGLKENLIVELNNHSKIYRQIYEMND